MKKIIMMMFLMLSSHACAMDFFTQSRSIVCKQYQNLSGAVTLWSQFFKNKNVSTTRCWLADLPCNVKNIIALYCWANQMRHENECQNKKYCFKECPTYRPKALSGQKTISFVNQDVSDYYYQKEYEFAASFKSLEDYSLCRGALCIAQHRTDKNVIALVDKTGKVQEYSTTTDLRHKCFARSGDGKKIAYVDTSNLISNGAVMEFDVGADIATAQVVAEINGFSKNDDNVGNVNYLENNGKMVLYRELVFRHLPSYDAWFVEHGDDKRVSEIVFRGKKSLAQVSQEKDHLSEFLRYRGVCKSLTPVKFSGKVINV